MTLIDLSIALLVVGLLAAPIIGVLDRKKIQDPRNLSESNISSAQKAIEDFYFETDRYPCPADPTLGPDNPDYGYENCTGADWAGDTTDEVLEGTIPFSTIKIPPEKALDGWQNKLLYAVNLGQSDPAIIGFDAVTGDLNPIPATGLIVARELKQVLDPVSDFDICPHSDIPGIQPSDLNPTPIERGHFIILSHGENAIGSYTAEGNLIEACDVSASGGAESENCDGDNVFLLDLCVYNTDSPTERYDDFAPSLSVGLPTRIWENPDITTANTATRVAKVGIGTNAPLFEVDIAGNLKAEGNEAENPDQKGNALAGSLCAGTLDDDSKPTTCFDPNLITGKHPNMDCNDTANAMTGIAKNKTLCGVTYFAGQKMDCPNASSPGTYMIGIQDGKALCGDPP